MFAELITLSLALGFIGQAVDTTSSVPDDIMICWALDNGAARGCDPLTFNGESSANLTGTRATFEDRNGTVAITRQDNGVRIVYTGRLEGGGLQGTLTYGAAGMASMAGKFTALAVTSPLPPEPGKPPNQIPTNLHICVSSIAADPPCTDWQWDGKHFISGTGALRVEQFSNERVILKGVEGRWYGVTAEYSGAISGSSFSGRVTWRSAQAKTWKGTWTGSAAGNELADFSSIRKFTRVLPSPTDIAAEQARDEAPVAVHSGPVLVTAYELLAQAYQEARLHRDEHAYVLRNASMTIYALNQMRLLTDYDGPNGRVDGFRDAVLKQVVDLLGFQLIAILHDTTEPEAATKLVQLVAGQNALDSLQGADVSAGIHRGEAEIAQANAAQKARMQLSAALLRGVQQPGVAGTLPPLERNAELAAKFHPPEPGSVPSLSALCEFLAQRVGPNSAHSLLALAAISGETATQTQEGSLPYMRRLNSAVGYAQTCRTNLQGLLGEETGLPIIKMEDEHRGEGQRFFRDYFGTNAPKRLAAALNALAHVHRYPSTEGDVLAYSGFIATWVIGADGFNGF